MDEPNKRKCPLRCCHIRNPEREDCKIKVAKLKQRLKERKEKQDNALVAQLVEHRIENPGVTGSTPVECTINARSDGQSLAFEADRERFESSTGCQAEPNSVNAH